MNITVGGLLLVAFIVLKLVGVIDWSWWWVLSPLWIGFVGVLAWSILGAVLADRAARRRRRRR